MLGAAFGLRGDETDDTETLEKYRKSPQAHGRMPYLDAKLQLQLSYLINLVKYLVLKSQSQDQADSLSGAEQTDFSTPNGSPSVVNANDEWSFSPRVSAPVWFVPINPNPFV